MDSKSVKDIYKVLLKIFGKSDLSGCLNLARLLDKYEPGDQLKDVYPILADEYHTTPAAFERSIRIYLNAIVKDYSIDDLGILLGYAFKPEQKTPKISEFVPVFKLKLEEID